MNRISLRLLAIALPLACSVACSDTGSGKPDGGGTKDSTASTSPVAVPATPVATQPATAVLDPNPAHGEPGHRCDIPVGASLSSTPPAPATVPGTQASPMMVSPQPAATPAPTGGSGRINPPHGEPGHDCAVAVGAPLP